MLMKRQSDFLTPTWPRELAPFAAGNGKSMIWANTKRAVLAMSMLTLCSCSALYDPYVSMGEDTPTTPSFQEAVKEARGKAHAFDTKLQELEGYDFASGALLFGSGLAGIGVAAFTSSSNALAATGLGVGAAAGARTFMPIQERKLAYASGSAAIDCAITAFSLNVGGGDKKPDDQKDSSGTETTFSSNFGPGGSQPIALSNLSGPLIEALGQLETIDLTTREGERFLTSTDSGMEFASSIEPNLVEAVEALDVVSNKPTNSKPVVKASAVAKTLGDSLADAVDQTARDRTNMVESFKGTIDARGSGLIAATAAIVHTVNAQIIAARLDPDGALGVVRQRSQAFTDSLTKQAEDTNKTAQDAAKQGEKAKDAAKSAEMTAESENNSDAKDKAKDMADKAKVKTAKVNEVARLAQRINAMVKQSASCAFGPARPSGAGTPSN